MQLLCPGDFLLSGFESVAHLGGKKGFGFVVGISEGGRMGRVRSAEFAKVFERSYGYSVRFAGVVY